MEIWDLLDRDGKLTGKTGIRGEEIPAGYYHLVVDNIILNSKGETLLQRRDKYKDVMPDIWSLTGGSAVQGEDSALACARETEEEMGFKPDMEHARVIYTERVDRPGRGYIRDVWLICQDVPLEDMRYQPGEVQDGMWILPEKIEEDPILWEQLSQLHCWLPVYPILLEESLKIRGLK